MFHRFETASSPSETPSIEGSSNMAAQPPFADTTACETGVTNTAGIPAEIHVEVIWREQELSPVPPPAPQSSPSAVPPMMLRIPGAPINAPGAMMGHTQYTRANAHTLPTINEREGLHQFYTLTL